MTDFGKLIKQEPEFRDFCAAFLIDITSKNKDSNELFSFLWSMYQTDNNIANTIKVFRAMTGNAGLGK